MTRKRIFEIIEKADYEDRLSAAYDIYDDHSDRAELDSAGFQNREHLLQGD